MCVVDLSGLGNNMPLTAAADAAAEQHMPNEQGVLLVAAAGGADGVLVQHQGTKGSEPQSASVTCPLAITRCWQGCSFAAQGAEIVCCEALVVEDAAWPWRGHIGSVFCVSSVSRCWHRSIFCRRW